LLKLDGGAVMAQQEGGDGLAGLWWLGENALSA